MYKFCQFEESSPINKTFQAGRLPNKTVLTVTRCSRNKALLQFDWLNKTHTHKHSCDEHSAHHFTMHIASYTKKNCTAVLLSLPSETIYYMRLLCNTKKNPFCSHTVHTRVEIGLLKIN
uniref:Uncharacterized protein n=1 Tax=Rhipicephalus microplus TaxID=6941 RepID=A0A6G5AGI5_RHIMP